MAEVRDEVREAAPATEPSEEEVADPDSERRAELRREREKADAARMQDALDEVLPDVFAAAREVSRRKLDMRPFDVQLMGAIVLHQGKIAEMKTGEGKTLVAPLAAALNAMSGWGVHLVTVNDYLAKRDPQWMGPIYHGLGLSVGIIQHDTAFLFDPDYRPRTRRSLHLRPVERKEAYAADVTYATNNELGFDYLRDNMVQELDERVQRERYFGIVDEVDNILIDEARTPLIISGAAGESGDLYKVFARLVPRLEARPENAEEGGDYFVDLKEHAVSATEEGVAKIEKMLDIRDLYGVETDPRLPRHFEQSLRAHALYKRDRDYIVKDDEIVIVDEFTGRQMPGRRWSEGLHQAIEAKEGVRVQRESMTMATVTFQNYFRIYDKLAGHDRYGHDRAGGVLQDLRARGGGHPDPPAHDPRRLRRPRLPRRGGQVQRRHRRDRRAAGGGPAGPGGHRIVEKSEKLASAAQAAAASSTRCSTPSPREGSAHRGPGRPHRRGHHRHQHGRPRHRHQARRRSRRPGRRRSCTHQGLNPAEVEPEVYDQALAEAKAECEPDHERVVAAGGLHIIGTERHDARRIDNQLRGRAGRQGDPAPRASSSRSRTPC